ncbi:MAG: cobalamin-binding protein [Gammaproteobacteria bacterium]|nr:cobalamin-binding protein [Gammaproteobacteria bacterium]
MLKPLLLLATLLFTLPLSAAISVEDDSGRTVALSVPAQRIISLAPHITEQLFAIGAGEQIVGAVEYSDFPEQAQAIPRVGGYSQLDLERILALEPELVVGWQSGNDPRQLERLEQLGLTVYRSEPRALQAIAASMRRLGVLSGRTEQAEAEATLFMQKLQRLAAMNRDRPARRVFYQIWNRPLMTINGEHLIADVIRLCGGENVFADLPALTPTISTEAVLAADPDIIIASGMGEARPEWLDEWRRWEQLSAVREQQLHFIPPDLLQRATPRLLMGAEQMCGMIRDASLPGGSP